MNLNEVAKRAPKAVICLLSALAFHGLTDQLPRKVWFAIGAKDWTPKIPYPPIRMVRFREPYYSEGIETHVIGGTKVRCIPSRNPLRTPSAIRNGLTAPTPLNA